MSTRIQRCQKHITSTFDCFYLDLYLYIYNRVFDSLQQGNQLQ